VTIRLLTPQDQPQLDAFLRDHTAETMILRSNLAQSGIVDGSEPYQGRYAAAFDGERIVGTAALYWQGMLAVYAPQHAGAVARMVADGRAVAGIIGPWQQALDAEDAIVQDGAHHKLRSREMLMALPLERLVLPAPLLQGQTLHCRRATAADHELLYQWRLDFCCESLGATPSQALAQSAAGEVTRWVAEGSQFILLDNGRPVAGCCFNARLPDTVQIGNVWTPPESRSRGYGRAVVAGALALARRDGVSQAVLFTPEDNPAAQTAYLAIGFTRIGDYAILLLAD
jgi:ribosomal protein S18 acetylase RimI-like enzyme